MEAVPIGFMEKRPFLLFVPFLLSKMKKKRQNRHCVQEGFEITELPGICYEVTSEVMGLHERLVVEVGDCGVLDVATNIEHLNSKPITNK